MSKLNCLPDNNFLQRNLYQLLLPRFPEVQYYAQQFNMPSLDLPAAQVSNPFVNLPLAGEKANYGPLTFSFILDSKLNNFIVIQEWIKSISYVEKYSDYTNYDRKDEVQSLGEQDISVLFLSANNVAQRSVTFYNAIPISLSGFEMSTTDPDTEYVYGQVVFNYDYYEFKKDL